MIPNSCILDDPAISGKYLFPQDRTVDDPFMVTVDIIQIIKGEAALTVGEESISGKPGTWIQMAAKTPHSIRAESPVVMLLTLLK